MTVLTEVWPLSSAFHEELSGNGMECSFRQG